MCVTKTKGAQGRMSQDPPRGVKAIPFVTQDGRPRADGIRARYYLVAERNALGYSQDKPPVEGTKRNPVTQRLANALPSYGPLLFSDWRGDLMTNGVRGFLTLRGFNNAA